MAHNLDTTNGQSSFVSAREDAWHGLGTTLPSGFTAEEAMEHGLLGGWNVRKTPIFTVLEDGSQLVVPERFAVVRDNPVEAGRVDVLGNVGDRYHVVQNEEHAAVLNALVDESGAHFETAGAIDGGRKVFLTMKLPGHMRVGGVDKVEHYIAAMNSHDGSTPFTILVTPVRIVCQNTLNVALRGAANQFRVRHTSGAGKGIVSQAREALDMTFNYIDDFQETAEKLINTELTAQQFNELMAREFGAPKDAALATVTRADNRLEELSKLFAQAGTQEGIRNTAWAGFNALTEYADHFSAARGSDPESTRHVRAVLDPSFKNKALDLMTALV